jgi:hypothetical protein
MAFGNDSTIVPSRTMASSLGFGRAGLLGWNSANAEFEGLVSAI